MSNRWQWPHVGRWCATSPMHIGDAIRQTAPEKAVSLKYATLPRRLHISLYVRYALFAPATHRTDVFRSACREGKKMNADAAPSGRYVRIRCAANRATSEYALTFLWLLPPCVLEREKLFVLRVPTLCVDSSCKSRVPVAFFIFASRGRAHASRRFSWMRE